MKGKSLQIGIFFFVFLDELDQTIQKLKKRINEMMEKDALIGPLSLFSTHDELFCIAVLVLLPPLLL